MQSGLMLRMHDTGSKGLWRTPYYLCTGARHVLTIVRHSRCGKPI
jgi:hypothetical protein